jgi:hypothetical protein
LYILEVPGGEERPGEHYYPKGYDGDYRADLRPVGGEIAQELLVESAQAFPFG